MAEEKKTEKKEEENKKVEVAKICFNCHHAKAKGPNRAGVHCVRCGFDMAGVDTCSFFLLRI